MWPMLATNTAGHGPVDALGCAAAATPGRPPAPAASGSSVAAAPACCGCWAAMAPVSIGLARCDTGSGASVAPCMCSDGITAG